MLGKTILKSIMHFLHKQVNACIDIVLPPRCPVTGEIVCYQGLSSAKVWSALEFISAPHCAQCGEPFEIQLEQGSICVSCLDNPPDFTLSRSAMMYNDAARAMILSFKHGDKLHIAKNFTPWLVNAGRDIWPHVDVIVPVPLHYWRLLKRRYNQAAIIADHMGREKSLPVIKNALIRMRYTVSQGHKKRKDRQDNVAGAFAVRPKRRSLIEGKSVLLIDDVQTTGATLNECTKILLENGASAVHILTVARVAAPNN